ncbi:MAG TPA: methyltransferase domain-containing protein [Xanthobacteraceae bacterium]|nr:methyltransferase domain-containing protein [Xanthobacteraceae bacterium]
MSRAAACRLCGHADLADALLLDEMPVSHYLRKTRDEPDPRFPLQFKSCRGCGLLQIVDPVPPEVLYRTTDSYLTGFQRPRHIDDLITTAVAYQDPARVVDIGCNDGALMDALARYGYAAIVGIEPNRPAAAAAIRAGHVVHQDFLSPGLAERLLAEHGAFDTAYLRHVAEHVGDLAGFFAAVRRLLREGGLLVMELPQVEAGLARGNPAILWEEHVNYFTEPLAAHLLARYGFAILDRRHYAFGGGSVAYLARKEAEPAAVAPPRPQPALRLTRRFAAGLKRYRAALRRAVAKAKAAGYGVAMYGAAPRSCMVAGACGISDTIDHVIDDRVEIQGRLMPGTGREIRSLEAASSDVKAPLLCLMGVGCENEYKVRTRLAARLRAPPVCISLFPPRDTLASIAAAQAAIAARPSSQADHSG